MYFCHLNKCFIFFPWWMNCPGYKFYCWYAWLQLRLGLPSIWLRSLTFRLRRSGCWIDAFYLFFISCFFILSMFKIILNLNRLLWESSIIHQILNLWFQNFQYLGTIECLIFTICKLRSLSLGSRGSTCTWDGTDSISGFMVDRTKWVLRFLQGSCLRQTLFETNTFVFF